MNTRLRGRPPLPKAGSLKRFRSDLNKYGHIATFVQQYVAKDPVLRGSKERAIAAACLRFCIADRRTIQRAVALLTQQSREWCEALTPIRFRLLNANMEAQRQLQTVERAFDKSEMNELQDVSMPLVYKLADARLSALASQSRKNGGRK